MSELAAYVDESQSHGPVESSYFSVSGTLASPEQWNSFQAEWRPLIAGLKKPFHAKDPACRNLALPLADLMRKHTILSCTVSFSMADYRKVVPQEVRSRFGSQYQLGVQGVLATFSLWSQEARSGRISYFVESGHAGFALVSKYLDAVCRSDEMQELWNIHEWRPASKADLPCHCADAVSHYGSRYEANNEYGDSAFLASLRGAGKIKEGLVSAEILESEYVPAMIEIAKRERGMKAALRSRKRKARLGTK